MTEQEPGLLLALMFICIILALTTVWLASKLVSIRRQAQASRTSIEAPDAFSGSAAITPAEALAFVQDAAHQIEAVVPPGRVALREVVHLAQRQHLLHAGGEGTTAPDAFA
jgi:hypothetical protein